MNKEELKERFIMYVDFNINECVNLAIEYSNTQNALLIKEVEELKEKQIPESLIDFISEVKYMVKQYQNSSYSRAEATRDELMEALDDVMRLEKFRTTDF